MSAFRAPICTDRNDCESFCFSIRNGWKMKATLEFSQSENVLHGPRTPSPLAHADHHNRHHHQTTRKTNDDDVNIHIQHNRRTRRKKTQKECERCSTIFNYRAALSEKKSTAEFKWENLLGGWKWTKANGNCEQNINQQTKWMKLIKLGKFARFSFVYRLLFSCGSCSLVPRARAANKFLVFGIL